MYLSALLSTYVFEPDGISFLIHGNPSGAPFVGRASTSTLFLSRALPLVLLPVGNNSTL
jgi:hypothetical protein